MGLCKVINGSETFIPNRFCSCYFKDNLAVKYLLHDASHIWEEDLCVKIMLAYFASADTMHI